ncbi:hypothetical protein J3458_000286 [Metarhizium acridum]|uniref:uncharacterized protein n=1 Tax=Metarhizium acridum TaxID=92637 RepID=UPI001C6C8EB5|nr:hypothetical protein J3458_000286 [Metarhizium acridum]
MESYRALSEKELPQGNRNSTIYSKITQHMTQILECQDGENDPNRLLFLKALHSAIDDCDEILTARGRGEEKSAGPLGPGQASADLHELRFRLARQNQRREIVQDVVRSHIQQVLRLLNEPDEQLSDAQSFLAPDMPSVSPRRYHERTSSPRFEDVDACGPDEKQFMLMEVYFEVIRMHGCALRYANG